MKTPTSTKKPIKVCNISPQGYTGIAYYDYSFCRSLQEAGVDVHFVTSKKWLIGDKPAAFTLRPFFVNTYGDRSRLIKGLNYILGSLKTLLYVLKERIPVVHYQLIELPVVDLFFFRMFKALGVKVIYTPHDIYNFKFSLSDRDIKKFFDLSDRVLAHNTANLRLLGERFGLDDRKLRLIRQGNMNDFLRPAMGRQQARQQVGLSPEKTVILWFGNIREGKGCETAAKAIVMLPDRKNTLFVLAGKPMRGYNLDPVKAALKENVDKEHYDLRIQFIEDDDVEAYFKAADIVLVPYEKIYTSAVFCFAFSCGCAVVASDVPEFADFVEDNENCLIFRAGDARDLADKVHRLVQDKSLRDKIAGNAKRYADSRWDWAETARVLKDIYTEVS